MTTITINRAVVEQALEAMRCAVPTGKITLYEWDKAMAELDAALAKQAEPVEPAFHGFMSADGTRVDVCFTPSAPRTDGTYATAYYTAPPQQAEPVADLRCAKWLDPECADKGACQSLRFKRQAAQEQSEPVEPVPTHRINSWGFCGVCRHDRIPGEGCARQECPDSPQQAEPVEPITRLFGTLPVHDAQQAEPVEHYASIPGTNVRVRLQPEPAQEPVAWVRLEAWKSGKDWPDDCFTALPAEGLTPVYTAPPKLVPLTEEEIDHIDACIDKFTPLREGKRLFARAVERALEEKNRGR